MHVLACPRTELDLPGGHYVTLHELVGEGSAALAYRGTLATTVPTREVCVKILRSTPDDPVELQVLLGKHKHLRHDNIVTTLGFDLRNDAAYPFWITEWIDGITAEEWMVALSSRGASRGASHSARPTFDAAFYLGLEIARGVAAAHRATDEAGNALGVVHGSPSLRDVMLTRTGEVKVGDFGLSMIALGGSHVHKRDPLAPRFALIAPEVACGAAADARSDVFSLGVLIHELVVAPRFAGTMTLRDVRQLVRDGTVYDDRLAPVPAPVRTVLKRALQVSPEKRYADASEFVDELTRVARLIGASGGAELTRSVAAILS